MLKKFFNDENGQGMVEYGLIIALVAVAVIVAITALGDNIKGIFNKAGSELSTAITSSSAT
ncbi:MAG TPA: Flp family type IVb pilin [Oscillospiraceae bacterium]|nr:Flp family type IVb pilin [Oscillospiraceae bacterium]HPF55297.1 Flp family type IVb pilin [Clostridiales bacterium]